MASKKKKRSSGRPPLSEVTMEPEAKEMLRKVQWKSSTVFTTNDKKLGHDVADLLLESVISACDVVREEEAFVGFEDPDFGPPLSELGTQVKDRLFEWGMKSDPKMWGQKLRNALEKRVVALQGLNKHGESAVYALVKEEEEEEDSDEEIPENVLYNRRQIAHWKSKLSPKQFWRWERVQDAETRTSTLFTEGALPSAPFQGSLNDGWLIDALALMATRAHALMGVRGVYQSPFHYPSDSKTNFEARKLGVFVLRFFFNFKWHFVLLDDRFIYTDEASGNKRCLFASNMNTKEMWAALCEKAFAKVCGSYEALNFGYVEEALQHLTGGMIENFEMPYAETTPSLLRENIKNSFWKALVGKLSKPNHVVACAAAPKNEEQAVVKYDGKPVIDDATGLIIQKPYLIVDAREVKVAKKANATNPDKQTVRLLRLRNPSGPSNWRQRWSDDSDLVNEERKTLQKTFGKEFSLQLHGVATKYIEPYQFENSPSDFLIALEDFKEHFQQTFVAQDGDDGEKQNENTGFVQVVASEAKGGWAQSFVLKLENKILDEQERVRRKLSVTGQEMTEYASVTITLWQEDKRVEGYGQESLLSRRQMKLVVTKKGSDSGIIPAGTINGTKPPCNQPNIIDGKSFLSSFQTMETNQSYILSPVLIAKEKGAQKACPIWMTVESEAPFTLLAAPKAKGGAKASKFVPMTTTCKANEGFEILMSPRSAPMQGLEKYLQTDASRRQASFEKIQDLSENLPAWQIPITDITAELYALEKTRQENEDSDDDTGLNSAHQDDERIKLWKSIRKEQWESEPPAFDDDIERNVSPRKKPGIEAPPSYEDDRFIVDPEKEMDAKKTAMMMSLPYSEVENADGTMSPPRSPFRSMQNLAGESAVVFRGMSIMNVVMQEGETSSSDTFVLVTVTENVEPYSMVFEVTHPGSSTTASRTFATQNMETILATKPRSMRSVDEEADRKYADSEDAVQQWIDTGDLPEHEHLVTWLIGRMKFYIKDCSLIIPAIDKVHEGKKEEDDSDEEIEMSVNDEDEDLSDAESWGPIMDEMADQAMPADEGEEAEESSSEEEEEESWDEHELESGQTVAKKIKGLTAGEMITSAGIYLKPADPFAAASFAAEQDLRRTRELEKERIRIAKQREETIYRKAREKRAHNAYVKHMKHLQSKELGRAIMMQEMAETIETQAKRQVARDLRLKRSMRSQTNPYKHNGEKSIKGPVIGPGPISADVTDKNGAIRYARENSKYVFDENGRRHKRKDMGAQDEGPPVERVIKRIQKMSEVRDAGWHLDLRKPFAQFDKNGDGRLNHEEFQQGIASIGVKVSKEEMDALLAHFDHDNSGYIEFQEFVWQFFNRRKLVSQWRLQRGPGKRSENAMLNSFYKYDIDGSGKLGRTEFRLAIEDVGLKLAEWEVMSLADRFDADGDGLISPTEFLAFMDSMQQEFQQEKERAMQSARDTAIKSKSKNPKTVKKSSEKLQYEILKVRVNAQRDKIRRLKAFIEAKEREMQKKPSAQKTKFRSSRRSKQSSSDSENELDVSNINPELSEGDSEY